MPRSILVDNLILKFKIPKAKNLDVAHRLRAVPFFLKGRERSVKKKKNRVEAGRAKAGSSQPRGQLTRGFFSLSSQRTLRKKRDCL